MPVLITALVAIGIQAAALFSRRVRRVPAPRQADRGAGGLPVGARRPRRLISRRSAA